MNITILKSRNLGRFKVGQRFFDGLDTGEGVNIFAGMIVLDVRRSWSEDSIEYLAIHPDFRIVPHGEILPMYEGTFTAGTALPVWHEVAQ